MNTGTGRGVAGFWFACVALLSACGGGGGAGSGSSAPPPPASPVTLSFSTPNGVAPYGQPISLNWISSASTCTAQGDWSGDKGAGGSAQFTVDRSVVLTLNCASGASSASASVRVQAIGTGSPTTSTLAYSATGLATLNYVILPIDGVAQVYDPVSGLIYAITSATSSSYPQSLVSIDPASSQVAASTPLNSAPWALAASADGQYLYVMFGALGAAIQRFQAVGLVPDLSIPLASSEGAAGISVSSASSTTIALTTVDTTTQSSQLRIFDGTTPRPNSYVAPQNVTLLRPVWTADGSGLVVPGSGEGVNVFAVDPQGVSLTKVTSVGGPYNGRLYGNIFYDDNGNVIDLSGPITLLGQMADYGRPTVSTRAENLAINKSFTLDSDSVENMYLTSYSASQFYAIDSVQIPLSSGLSGPGGSNVILWGSDGVAWNEGGSLVIAHGNFVGQGGSLAPIQSLPTVAAGNLLSANMAAVSYAIYDIEANDIAADSCGNVYAGISDGATFFPNSVLTFDAMSGAVVTSNYAISQPSVLAAADDCTTIYAGSRNSNSIARLNVPSLTSAAVIPLTQSPLPSSLAALPFAQSLSIAPGNANMFAVTMNFHGSKCDGVDYGVAVYDGATRRPNVYNPQSGPKSVVWGKDTSRLYEEDLDGIYALAVDGNGPSQPTLLVPYASLEGDTGIYDLFSNLYFDSAKSRVLSGDGAAYDTVAATSVILPVTKVLDGNGCGLFNAVTTDQQTGTVFTAQFDTTDDSIVVFSFDSQTLKKIDQVRVPKPSGLSSIGGPFRLVRPSNSNTVALATSYGYVVALSGPMFAK
jgi:hypothetical protein